MSFERATIRATYLLGALLAWTRAVPAEPSGPAAAPGAAPAPPTPAADALAAAGKAFEIPFEKYTLDNGLEVILHRDPSLPLWRSTSGTTSGPPTSPRGARASRTCSST